MNGFEKGLIYLLVDFEGLKREPFASGLADYIKKTGNTIRPMLVDGFGRVMSVKFGDGTMSCECIESHMTKYFEIIDPLALETVIVPPKLLQKDAEIIQFKHRKDQSDKLYKAGEYLIEPVTIGSYQGACAA